MTIAALSKPDHAAPNFVGFIPRFTESRVDPFDQDEAGDLPVLTSERRLQRLTIVAAETGARFVREAIAHDPVAWMLAPRELFGGERPMDACQKVGGFLRATMLHALALGLDADPDQLDMLIDGDVPDDTGSSGTFDPPGGRENWLDRKPRLFTCLIDGRVGASGTCVQAFCAMVVTSPETVRSRLRNRYGDELAASATISEGFEQAEPLARQLLSEPMKKLLALLAANPSSDLGRGLDIQVEQRFSL